MNKDEIQQSKALIKLKNIQKLIDILQNLNLLEDEKEMKDYTILLDYDKSEHQDFTTFKVKVSSKGFTKENLREEKNLFNFNFKLKDENTGFAIFKKIREYFVMKNDLQGPSFTLGEGSLKYSSHIVRTNHHVTLCSIIHTKKDEEKLEKFNHRIYEKYNSYIRKVHTIDSDKDQTQLLKAKKKQEIAFIAIDMLHELNEVNSTYDKTYEFLLDCKKIGNCYNFKFQILKNSKSIPFNINFKLKDKKLGIDMLNEIIEYYIKNYGVLFDSYSKLLTPDKKRDYVIIGENRVNINYKIPEEFFDDTISQFRNQISERKNAKKLQKSE